MNCKLVSRLTPKSNKRKKLFSNVQTAFIKRKRKIQRNQQKKKQTEFEMEKIKSFKI